MDRPRRRRFALPVRLRHLRTLFVFAFVLALFFYYARAFRSAGLGFLAVAALSAALRPLVRFIPFRRWLAGIIVGLLPALLIAGAITLAAFLLTSPIKHEIEQWPQVQHNIDSFLLNFSNRAGISPPMTLRSLFTRFGPSPNSSSLFTVTTTAEDLFIAVVLVSFGVIFYLATPPGLLLDSLLKLLPPTRQAQLSNAMLELQPKLRWWVIGTLVAMVVVGLCTWAGFTIIGLQFSTPLALLAGLSELIPYIGPAFTFLLALLFAATQGWHLVLYVVILWMLIHIIEGYIVQPLVMRQAVHIPPLITLFTLIFWGEAFGLPGLLLSVPLNLLIWTLAQHFLRRDLPTPTAIPVPNPPPPPKALSGP